MSTFFTILQLALVLVAGWALTWKLLPWAWVKVGRLLGFKMRMTPIARKRLERFKRIRRGYFAFVAITTLFVTSQFLELLVNDKPLYIAYQGKTAMPAVRHWLGRLLPFGHISSFEKASDFGQLGKSGVDYHAFNRYAKSPEEFAKALQERRVKLKKAREAFLAKTPEPGEDASTYEKRRYARRMAGFDREASDIEKIASAGEGFRSGEATCWMPLYPHHYARVRTDIEERPPNSPNLALGIPLGTDTAGYDVLTQLVYGFRLSLSFALLVALLGYAFGVVVGGIQGYYGGWIDIITQRIVEIWGSIPFLFTIMIIAAMIMPSFWLLLVLMVVLRSWLGITYYVRGEFYREKSKDYVQAAIGSGVSDWKIITRHILPNALVPVVTFAPFGIVAYISSLVSLDYLGFGLPPGEPSWGALLRQGLENVRFYPHLVIVPTLALALTLYTVVMVGEAVREAFDPKVFSRLR